jgi:hypothetical protein
MNPGIVVAEHAPLLLDVTLCPFQLDPKTEFFMGQPEFSSESHAPFR